MARALRFEYPGADYHVINRGNYRSWIFEEEGAKLSFEQTLFEACQRAGWLSSQLNMGADFGVSRYVRELKEGTRPGAAEALKKVRTRIHS